jgi:hypothetical protein
MGGVVEFFDHPAHRKLLLPPAAARFQGHEMQTAGGITGIQRKQGAGQD